LWYKKSISKEKTSKATCLEEKKITIEKSCGKKKSYISFIVGILQQQMHLSYLVFQNVDDLFMLFTHVHHPISPNNLQEMLMKIQLIIPCPKIVTKIL
jgi:putative ribosome biogenesis GTPase RsgA